MMPISAAPTNPDPSGRELQLASDQLELVELELMVDVEELLELELDVGTDSPITLP